MEWQTSTDPHIEPPRSASFRCTQCNDRRKEDGRNLVICIDGTSHKFGCDHTNVMKLQAKIDQHTTSDLPKQHVYYSSGIGTRPKPLNIFDRMKGAVSDLIDQAVAWNMGETVKDAYSWLAQTYQAGDQIYLFGYSRGACQVRILAGMVYEVGLLRMPTAKQIGEAYDLYQAVWSGNSEKRRMAKGFKDTFSREGLRVHFVGVWDTVSSVGLIRDDVRLSSPAHACHFRHALALDECRVKFMSEYFYGKNSQTDDGRSSDSLNDEDAASFASEKAAEIKEVWFPGSHSDVGGTNGLGTLHHAGNISLLWMRREAAANGLVLKPTDVTWVPDDIDFGITDSMTALWRILEYVPFTYQGDGTGEDTLGPHMMQPRRMMPGQKIHVSVLYASAYRPKAVLGEGLDIATLQSGLDDTPLDDQVWETGLFDDTAAQELLAHLSGEHVAPIHLDRLLFMLRFNEGKQCVRDVPGWQDKFMSLIYDQECAPLIRLVAIVAYHEVSCDPETHPNSRTAPHSDLPPEIFNDAKKWILAAQNYGDHPRVFALMRPLTKHLTLQEQILTPDVLETFVKFLDVTIKQPKGRFGQAMDCLNCLLRCDHTRQIIVKLLGANAPGSDASRLSWILEVDQSHLLRAALCVVLTLTRIPQKRATVTCSAVKPRIGELASKDESIVGLLAVEILLALYDLDNHDHDHHLNLRNAHVQANIARAVARLDPDRRYSPNEKDPGEQILRRLFGLGTTELNEQQMKIIRELKKAVEKGDTRERTGATVTLLKLCETMVIRTYLRDIDLLSVFASQLRRKDSTSLAAFALETCLKYSDMKGSIRGNEYNVTRVLSM